MQEELKQQMRAEFEAWHRKENGATDVMFVLRDDGHYAWGRTFDMYAAFQVAWNRRTPVSGEVAEGWISVEDRLPDVGQGCIAYRPTAPQTQDPLFSLTHYTGRMQSDWQNVEHGFHCLVHPTHWMPLPPVPDASSLPGGGSK